MSVGEFKWACPKCGMDHTGAHRTSKQRYACKDRAGGDDTGCGGFVCDCDADAGPGHGDTLSDPCYGATCYHCDWRGQWPPRPTKMKPWEKKALDAGWTPPVNWNGQ